VLIVEVYRVSESFYESVRSRLKKFKYRFWGRVFLRDSVLYVISLLDPLSLALAYAVYKKARERGFETAIYYALSLKNEEVEKLLPSEVKILGDKIARGIKLSTRDYKNLPAPYEIIKKITNEKLKIMCKLEL